MSKKIENFAPFNLKTLRTNARLSRRELVQMLETYGVKLHQNSLRRIEEGEQALKIEEAVAFAQIFDVNLESFITEALDDENSAVMMKAASYFNEMDKLQGAANDYLIARMELALAFREIKKGARFRSKDYQTLLKGVANDDKFAKLINSTFAESKFYDFMQIVGDVDAEG